MGVSIIHIVFFGTECIEILRLHLWRREIILFHVRHLLSVLGGFYTKNGMINLTRQMTFLLDFKVFLFRIYKLNYS